MRAAVIFFTALLLSGCYEIMPRNTMKDCRSQCNDLRKPKACLEFCECIHKYGNTLDSCLEAYEKTPLENDSTEHNH